MILKAALTVCACKIRVEDKSRKGRKMRKATILMLAGVFSILIVQTNAIDTTDLVAYWNFDEDSGPTAHDSAGTNDGTLLNGPVWTTGIVNGALEFDGNNDYVDVGYLGELSTWTISLWANSDTQGTYHTFISQDQTSWNDDILFGICPQGTSWSTRDKIAVIFHRADYTEYVVEDNEDIQIGQWYNTIVTYDGSTMILYVNSIQKDSVVATDLVISDQRWTIGRNPHDNYPSAFRQFDGTIDEVILFDRGLSAAEVNDLYTYGIVEPNLINIEIEGPNEVAEETDTAYKAIAVYDNNSTKDVTDQAYWAVMPDNYADINDSGLLTTDQLIMPTEDVTIYAEYQEGNTIVQGEKDVQIFALCPQGNALDFDGVDDYVDTTTLEEIDQPITISVWIKTYESGVNKCIFGRNQAISPQGYFYENFLWINSESHIYYGDRPGGGGVSYLTSIEPIQTNKWYHIGITRDASSYARLYINGNLDNSHVVYDYDNTGVDYRIGRINTGHYTFNGKIDQLMIYNRVLSSEEIQAAMLQGPDFNEPNLIAYWKFDKGSGQIAHDSSGNANDGYLGSDPCNPDTSDPCWVEPGRPVPCTLEGFVEKYLDSALDKKTTALELIADAIADEWIAENALEVYFHDRDFGNSSKKDVVKAKQQINQAIQHEEQAEDVIDKSVENLEDAMDALDL